MGLWAGYDVENYGDALFARIMLPELRRRLPGAELTLFAPLGTERRMRMNAGWPIHPLGDREPARMAELAASLDLVVVGGGELIHPFDWALAVAYGLPLDGMDRRRPTSWWVDGLGPELERTCPVVWSGVGVPFELEGAFAERVRVACAGRPYLSVRDLGSRERLRRAGVEADVAVVPDCVLLLPRLLPPSVLAERRDALRAAGWYPPAGDPLVVQAHTGLVPWAAQVAEAIGSVRAGRPVVLLSVFPAAGDARFAEALAPLLGDGVWTMPELAAPEDVAVAVAGAAGVVATSLHVSITSVAYDRPLLLVNQDRRVKLDGFAESMGLRGSVATPDRLAEAVGPALSRTAPAGALADAQYRIDAHFDRIAEIAAGLARAERPPLTLAPAPTSPAARARSGASPAAARSRR